MQASRSDVERPLLPYAGLMAAYSTALASFLRWRRGEALPNGFSAGDVALLGIATHKLTRIIAKDTVTAAVRAPFTEYQGPAGPGEVREAPRGRGMRRAVGELVSCPYCLGPWVATALAAGAVVAPRETRFVAAVLASVATSDFLQIAYKRAEQQL